MTILSTKDLHDRILGSLLGGAIGDALGYPVEFSNQTPDDPKVFGPELTTMDGQQVSIYSDDTQMTRAVAEGLIFGSHDFARSTKGVSAEFISWLNGPPGGHRAPGSSCLHGCANLRGGVDWSQCGRLEMGGGCGSAMRSAPYGWLWYDDLNKAVEWAAKHSTMTHRHPMGIASAASVAAAVATAFGADGLDHEDAPWFIAETTATVASKLDESTGRRIYQAMSWASPEGRRHRSPTFVLDKFRGFAGHEAVAASIYCFLRHPYDYERAVLLAVNSPGDSDSLGAITGSISGAFLGATALPEAWVKTIEKRDQLFDLAARFVDMMVLQKENRP